MGQDTRVLEYHRAFKQILDQLYHTSGACVHTVYCAMKDFLQTFWMHTHYLQILDSLAKLLNCSTPISCTSGRCSCDITPFLGLVSQKRHCLRADCKWWQTRFTNDCLFQIADTFARLSARSHTHAWVTSMVFILSKINTRGNWFMLQIAVCNMHI